MTCPTVTELPRTREPITRDPFIDSSPDVATVGGADDRAQRLPVFRRGQRPHKPLVRDRHTAVGMPNTHSSRERADGHITWRAARGACKPSNGGHAAPMLTVRTFGGRGSTRRPRDGLCGTPSAGQANPATPSNRLLASGAGSGGEPNGFRQPASPRVAMNHRRPFTFGRDHLIKAKETASPTSGEQMYSPHRHAPRAWPVLRAAQFRACDRRPIATDLR
jgi:hypothetical protein